MQKYEQPRKNPRVASHPGAIRGLFYSLSKHNRYLTAILQRIHQAVIVVYGYAVDHSVPQFFVKLDGRCFKLFKLGEHTADGYGLGKTNYMLFESVVTNTIYYGIAFILYATNVWTPTLTGIALLFGIGNAFDSIVSLVAYAFLLKKEKINILSVE